MCPCQPPTIGVPPPVVPPAGGPPLRTGASRGTWRSLASARWCTPPRTCFGRAGLLPDIIGRDGSRSCQSDSGKRLSRRGPARLWPSRPTWLSLQSDQRIPTLWHLRLTTTTSAAYRSALSQCLLIAGRSQQQLLLLHRMRRENTPSYVCFRRSPGTYALPG